jgi:hypothetical protein
MKQTRKKNALTRLETQLESGVKHNKGINTPLLDSDKLRIEKEIKILKSKI